MTRSKANLRPDIPAVSLDLNVNDPAFADATTACLLEYVGATAKKS